MFALKLNLVRQTIGALLGVSEVGPQGGGAEHSPATGEEPPPLEPSSGMKDHGILAVLWES